MENITKTVLIVEGDQVFIELLRKKVEGSGYQTVCVQTAGEAIHWLKEHTPFLILLDYSLPDMNGKEFIAEIKTDNHPLPPFIVSTGQSDERIVVELMKLGARDYIIKDIHFLNMIPLVISKVSREIENESKLRLAEQALHDSEERYKSLFLRAGEGIFIMTTEGKLVEVNESFAVMHGYTVEEMLLMDLKDLDTYESVKLMPERMNHILAGNNLTFEVEHFHKNGHVFSLEVSASIIAYKGETYIQCFHRDITERKHTEEALKESALKYRSLIECSSDAIFCVDEKGEYKFTNHLFASTFGKSPEDFIGKTFWDIYDKQQADYRYEATKRVFHTGKSETIEVEVTLPDKTLYFLATANPIKDETGKVILCLTHAADITKIKMVELELQKAKERAEESDQLKSAFLANMSHEIRTPMNGILGFADLLKEPNLTGEEQQKYISVIEKSGARMLNIINDIIDISKIEAGLMKAEIQESNINAQIEYIYTFFKPEVEAKGMKFLFRNTLPAKEAIIQTDREKLYAIFTNLVKNAIKYTNEGFIEFGYSVEMQNSASLRFYVKDTGIGIPKDRQEAIFERFVQADIEDKKARQGAGLGLAITKSYIQMLGGKIWVESEEGIGSTFYFTLPYNPKPQEKPTVKKVVSIQETGNITNPLHKRLKILIAEDDETSEKLISIIVNMFGREIIKAHNGLAAIEACQENQDIDLILMDIQMPVMGGYEATQKIRLFNKEVIIIAQTAYGLSGDREKAIEAGCNDYIAKPINSNALKGLVQKYFDKKEG